MSGVHWGEMRVGEEVCGSREMHARIRKVVAEMKTIWDFDLGHSIYRRWLSLEMSKEMNFLTINPSSFEKNKGDQGTVKEILAIRVKKRKESKSGIMARLTPESTVFKRFGTGVRGYTYSVHLLCAPIRVTIG
jgi:hypothetical protein